ncbi:hypothetical protein EON79_06780, partial [bacterium]
TVVAWGADYEGETVVPAGLKDVVAIAASGSWSLALKADGTVVQWGYNFGGLLNPPAGLKNVVGIAAGFAHALAVKSDGTVVAWGANSSNQCDVPLGLGAVVQVSAGGNQSLALKSDGKVVGWGPPSAKAPSYLDGVTRIAAGYDHSLALTSVGGVVAWGQGLDDQINVPRPLSGVTLIAASDFSLAFGHRLTVSVNRTEMYAGESAIGTVELGEAAESGGAVVTLRASNPLVKVPETVTVPEGESMATFPISSELSFGAGFYTSIAATYRGDTNEEAEMYVEENGLRLALNTPSFIGGSSTKPILTATLAWPLMTQASLTLEATDAALLLPPSVVFKPGEKTFKIPLGHVPVPTDRDIGLALLYKGQTVTSTGLKLRAIKGALSIDPGVLTQGQTGTGTVTLTGFVQQPFAVTLASNHPSISVPSTVTVPAGARTVTFPVSAVGAGSRMVEVTAIVNGTPTTASVYVDVSPEVKNVEIPSAGYGLSNIPVRVRLKAVAPAGGAIVRLASSDPALRVPATVRIAEGTYYTDVVATTTDLASAASATVTATVGTSSAIDTIALTPVGVHSVTASAASVKGGDSFELTITLNTVLRTNTLVGLTTPDGVSLVVPHQTNVNQGMRSRTITIKTRPVTGVWTVSIVVTKNGKSETQKIKITP